VSCRLSIPSVHLLTRLSFIIRISPRNSREPTPTPPTARSRDPYPQDTPQPKPVPQPLPDLELDLPSSPPPIEAVLAARRAKRLAILAKYSGAASVEQSLSPGLGHSSAVQPPQSVAPVSDPMFRAQSSPGPSGMASESRSVRPSGELFTTGPATCSLACYAGHALSRSSSPTPGGFDLEKHDEEEDAQVKVQAQNGGTEQISAADYDPSLDRREDEQKRVRDGPGPADAEVEMVEEEEEEEEYVDDMFAVVLGEKKTKKVKRVVVRSPDHPISPAH
jgi:serine/threonine-protein kinase PRP4